MSLDDLRFDNRFVRELPADPSTDRGPRQVRDAIYSRVQPEEAPRPATIAVSAELADALGIAAADLREPRFARVFSGAELLPAMDPHAMCYGGHQFGHWAGQLGDGRAINLGEVIDRSGAHQMLQLKGAGPTPYSRSGDGYAVLRSSVREFLCSEAMHALGVPTTRALSLVTTGESVVRDMFYDGHPEYEPGAVVCRVAPSFLRFGNFELLAATKQPELLSKLIDFTVRTLYPAHWKEGAAVDVVEWFDTVCRRTAELVVHWQRVGFVHGVLNTDNMSVAGLTIDYGPYGWLEDFNPDWTPNTTDAQQRRYRFGQQGRVAQWNLIQLGSSLATVVGDPAPLQRVIDDFEREYDMLHSAMQFRKLGLADVRDVADDNLSADLLAILRVVETDMTLFYRALAGLPVDQMADADPFEVFGSAYYRPEQLDEAYRDRLGDWLRRYAARVRSAGLGDSVRRHRMNAFNPKYVLRNYLAQQAIEKAEAGDPGMIHELYKTLQDPYAEQPDRSQFAARRPEWARHKPGCSTLSCSS